LAWPEHEGDELAALAAAGGAHCATGDFARIASYELAAIQGKDPLLSPATAGRWQELTQHPAAGATGGDSPRRIFGGSPAISAACALWPTENPAVVVAASGGGANLQAIIGAVKELCLAAAGETRPYDRRAIRFA
jgi:hypothetical protein